MGSRALAVIVRICLEMSDLASLEETIELEMDVNGERELESSRLYVTGVYGDKLAPLFG